MRTDKAGRLKAERDRLRSELVNGQNAYPLHAGRLAQIDRELATLARQRAANRLYRETMYDLNGHHGRA